jgi:hypothetical protein
VMPSVANSTPNPTEHAYWHAYQTDKSTASSLLPNRKVDKCENIYYNI